MAYIFMDESGCLGFDPTKKKTSKNFIISFVLTSNKRPLEKVVRKAFISMSPKERKGHFGVLHASKEKPSLIKKVLEDLTRVEDVKIMYVRLNKEKVFTHLKDEKQVLYNYVTNILLGRLIDKKLFKTSQINLIAAQRETNKILNEQFQSYTFHKVKKDHAIHINVDIKPPSKEKCLQVADFVSWASFRKYEYNDSGFYDIISEKVIEDRELFE